MLPCLSLRDWYEGGKSNPSGHRFSTRYLMTPVSPFHAEPLQEKATDTFKTAQESTRSAICQWIQS